MIALADAVGDDRVGFLTWSAGVRSVDRARTGRHPNCGGASEMTNSGNCFWLRLLGGQPRCRINEATNQRTHAIAGATKWPRRRRGIT